MAFDFAKAQAALDPLIKRALAGRHAAHHDQPNTVQLLWRYRGGIAALSMLYLGTATSALLSAYADNELQVRAYWRMLDVRHSRINVTVPAPTRTYAEYASMMCACSAMLGYP
jgi:hypothetical protein